MIRTTTGIVGGLLLLIGLVSWLVTLPAVQTYLVDQSQYILSNQLGVPVEIQEVDVDLPVKLVLEKLSVCDTQNEHLVKINELKVSALNFDLWNYLFNGDDDHELRIADIDLIGTEILLYQSMVDSSLNLQFLLDAFSSEDTTPSSSNLAIILEDIFLEDAHFTYVDSTTSPSAKTGKRVDFSRLEIVDLGFQGSFALYPDSLMEIGIEDLQLVEKRSNYTIRQLDIWAQNFLAVPGQSNGQLLIPELSLKTPLSSLVLQADLPGVDLETLIDDPDLIDGSVHFSKGSYFHFDDIEPFLEEKLPVKGRLTLQGEVRGGTKQLRSKQLILGFGEQSGLTASGKIKNYLVTDDLTIDILMKQSRISLSDLQALLPDIGLPKGIQPLKQLELVGSFKGYVDDFEVDASMDTDVGSITADMFLKLPPKVPFITYKGKLNTKDLNLDLLGISADPLSNKLTFDGEVEGVGSTLSTFEVFFDAAIVDSDIAGYAVKNATFEVDVKNEVVDGQVYWEDSTGSANLDLDIDLSINPSKYNINGKVDKLNLKTYDILEEPILLSSLVSIALTGDSLENLNGTLLLDESKLEREDRNIESRIPEFYANLTSIPGDKKYVNLKSSFLDADMAGSFQYNHALELIERLIDETDLFFNANDSLSHAYYLQKVPDSIRTQILLGLAVRDSANSLLAFFDQSYRVAPGTFLTGEFLYEGRDGVMKEVDQLEFKIQSDSVSYEGITVKNIQGDYLLLKPALQDTFLVSSDTHLDSVIFGPSFAFQDLSFRLDLKNNLLKSTIDFIQRESKGEVSFSSTTEFLPDGSIRSQIDPLTSVIRIYGDTLRIEPGDSILYKEKRTMVRDLILQTNDRFYRMDGVISDRPEDLFTFQIGKFDMANLNAFYPLEYKLEGDLIANITGYGVLGETKLEMRSLLQDFKFEGFDYGNIRVDASYSDSLQEISTYTQLKRQFDTLLVMQGTYNLTDTISPLDMDITTVDGVPLNYISPFVEEELDSINGKIKLSEFNLTGNLNQPRVDGKGSFDNAGFQVEYLQTKYVLNGDMRFENKTIHFDDIQVKDGKGSAANLYGDLRVQTLDEVLFNLQLESAKNFLVMNTDKYDNELFYGRLLLNDAVAYISGDLNDIKVEAITAFASGSEINMPITDEDEYGRPDYIVFEGEQAKGLTAETGLQGFDFTLTALATEELGVNMIFDERVGDIIRARGEGDLTLVIDESGTFSILGDYRVTQGNYLFTLQNLIGKKFTVRSGGSLTWDGDPFEGVIDLDAVYPVYADISPLTGSDVSNRVLTNVIMHLEGPVLQPLISLSIEIPNVDEETGSSLITYLRSIQYDEAELNNQVFSLILFNRFAQPGSLVGASDNNLAVDAVATSLSEMISNQLNYWVTQATGDKINVNVNTDNFSDLNLLVSAKLFGDRVTIERDGTVIQGDNASTGGSAIQDIVGNISIVIRLLPSPNSQKTENVRPPQLVVEVFGREDLGTTDVYQTGVGFLYKKDLDKLSELFKRQQKAKVDTTASDSSKIGG